MIPPVQIAKRYYASLPDVQHRTGDIWSTLSTFGLIRTQLRNSGLVITPACDLANHKTPTITYLPIVSVRAYLATEFGYSMVRPALVELFEGRLRRNDLTEFLDRGRVPDETVLEFLEEEVKKSSKTIDSTAVDRMNAGLFSIRKLNSGDISAGKDIRATLKPDDWKKFCENIVRNSGLDDVHFLPPEEPVEPWSAVPEPSLVLFRYPLTIPRTLLDAASSSNEDWPTSLKTFSQHHQSEFSERPLKVTRLSTDFLSDLLTRFARLYVRIGAPDFSRESVRLLAEKVEGAWKL